MSPVTVAAVFITATLCAVAAYVLLLRQERRHDAYAADLRYLLSRAAARRDDAEGRLREMAGESTALDEWEQDQFDGITRRFRADVGLEILGGDEGGVQ